MLYLGEMVHVWIDGVGKQCHLGEAYEDTTDFKTWSTGD